MSLALGDFIGVGSMPRILAGRPASSCSGQQVDTPFRTLLVEFYAKSPAGQAVAVEQRKYFDGGAERLAGIFDDSGQLQAFGSEQVSFYPDEAAPPTVGWKRVAEWQGRIGLEGDMAAWHVATVDIEGRFTLYRHGPLGLLEPPPQ